MKTQPTDTLLTAALDAAKQADDLDAADRILNGYGIECVTGPDGETLHYVNLGDTYDATICKDSSGYFIGSWGDWYEQAERDHEEDTGTIRCGYCGEFTDMDQDNWRDVRCTSCGHLVSGGD